MTIAALPPTSRAHASVSELSVAEPSDDDLVARAQAGDAWAEEALFRRHVGRVASSRRACSGAAPRPRT